MDKEQTKAAVAVMAAFCEEREIEYFDEVDKKWRGASKPSWDFLYTKYRIKPSKKLVPFTMDNCPVGKVVRTKNRDYRGILEEAGVLTVLVPWSRPTYEILLERYTMDDGSPCGIEVTE